MTPAALSSRIEAVTVYRRGARITRVAEVEATALPAVVRIGGLPLGLDDSSVRARVEPIEGGGAVPIAFDLRVALDVPAPDPSLPSADDAQLEAARLEDERLERLAAHIESELERLDKLTVVGRPRGEKGHRPPPSPVAARQALVAFRIERERALRDELREVRDQADRAERQREMLEERRRRASADRQAHEHELRKAVVVSLRGEEARCRLVLEYQVPGACWAPVYTVKLDEGMSGAALSARAVVAQNSGEDWTAVAMTLSTAEATAWTELPELASIRIGRRQPAVAKLGWRPPPSGVDDLYRDRDRAFARRIDPPSPATTTPEMDQTVEEFEDNETLVDRKVALPPPPPSFAQSVAMPVAEAPARRRAPGGMAAVMLSAPAAIAKAVNKTKESAKGRREEPVTESSPYGGFQPDSGESLEGELEGELQVGGELLRYGDLRMRPASAPDRGRLVPAQRRELYLELLVEQRVQVRVDVVSAVERARGRAAEVANRVPPGCQLAWSEAFDYAYPAEARVDVPSDADFHSIPLAEKRTGCEPRYVVVPRESTDVFRTASVENPLESPLLPGPIDVYLRGDFLLTTRLELTPPRGRFTLGLGVEQAIKVARNIRYREESVGLMGGALLLHHQISVEIRNNLPVPAPVEVRERTPVTNPGDDDVEVKVQQASPAWEEWKQDKIAPHEPELRGGRRWRITVPPGGKQELKADYEVKISAKQELVGGNRREA